uniref:FXNA-like protease n=1 Tax=Romanomermis culicivorax TaxID=13658 RepID=A0A915KZN7_ROMCU
MSRLRSRKQTGKSNVGSQNGQLNDDRFDQDDEDDESKSNRHLLTSFHWIILGLYVVLTYSASRYSDLRLAAPLPSTAPSNVFSEGRARAILKKMVDFGSKPAGSYAAEVLTKNLLIEEIQRAKTSSKSSHKLEIDVQKASDCYDFHFITPFLMCYKNITNVIVRLSPTKVSSNVSVLVNCHFDSVVGSPGGTDDLAACAVMLEILRVITQTDAPLTHNIVFLFNGAEENFMQGSHAFITKHKWRHEIRAFVNMEGLGSGGREFLFQTGPSDIWLLHAYLDSVKYPHGSILAQEVYQSGAFISETDYRIFREYGRLSGLDLAYTHNGFLYHTEFDDEKHIEPGSLQQMGENILATARTIANSECLRAGCPHKEEVILFFDVLGLFVVQYRRFYATIINYVVCALVAAKIFHHITFSRMYYLQNSVFSKPISFNSDNVNLRYSFRDFASQFLIMFSSILVVGLTTVLAAIFVLASSLTMFWYSRWILFPLIYVIPPTFAGLAVHAWSIPRAGFLRKQRGNRFLMEQLNHDVALTILSSVLFLVTSLGIKSTYYALIHVIFALLRDSIVLVICKLTSVKRSATLILKCQLFLLIPVAVIASYAVVEVLNTFIPLMGRAASSLNPEIVLAGIGFIISSALVILLSNFVYITRNVKRMIVSVLAVNLILFFVACYPGVIEPFKFSLEAPTCRRLHIQHVKRKIPSSHEMGSKIIEEDGLWFAPLDYRGIKDLPKDFFLSRSSPIDCHNITFDNFCALPYYIPARKVVPPEQTLWVPTPSSKPTFSKAVSVELVNRKIIDKNKIILDFIVDGADHISAYITGTNKWTVDYFIIDSKIIRISEIMDTYFMYLANVQTDEPWRFSVALLTLESKFDRKQPIAYIGAASHEMHGQHRQSEMLRNVTETVALRRKRHSPGYHWKWAMTVDSWSTDYLGKYIYFPD